MKKTYLFQIFQSNVRSPLLAVEGDVHFLREQLEQFAKSGKQYQWCQIAEFIDGKLCERTDGYNMDWQPDLTDAEIEDAIAYFDHPDTPEEYSLWLRDKKKFKALKIAQRTK